MDICELRQALEASALKAAMERNARSFGAALGVSVQRMTRARQIATYVASVIGDPTPERHQQSQALLQQIGTGSGAVAAAADRQTATGAAAQERGASIYASTCAPCHESGRALPYGGLNFALSTAVNAPSPQNIVNVTLFGIPAADGEASSVMPGFAGVLSDDDMAALLRHMRERFTDKPEWTNLTELVRRTRTGEHKVSVRSSDGIGRAPANVGAEE